MAGLGYSMGVAAGDYDNDGFVDLYVTGVNTNQPLHNNGDGTFTDVTAKAGVLGNVPGRGKAWSVTAGWFDYNSDGLLDLLVINYLDYDLKTAAICSQRKITTFCSPDDFKGLPNILYKNNGDGTFTDVSLPSHVGKYVNKGMGVAFADYDGDGFTDVFVSNDTFPNLLLHNNGDGTFTDEATAVGVAYNELGKTVAGMGADFRDLDNDGRPDIFHTAMFGDSFPLYKNLGDGRFEDSTSAAGLTASTSRSTAWGVGAYDFANVGRKDLFTANAAILDNSMEIEHRPYELPNSLFRNLGHMTFADVSAAAGPSFRVAAAHRGHGIWRPQQRRQGGHCGHCAQRTAGDPDESHADARSLDPVEAGGCARSSRRDGHAGEAHDRARNAVQPGDDGGRVQLVERQTGSLRTGRGCDDRPHRATLADWRQAGADPCKSGPGADGGGELSAVGLRWISAARMTKSLDRQMCERVKLFTGKNKRLSWSPMFSLVLPRVRSRFAMPQSLSTLPKALFLGLGASLLIAGCGGGSSTSSTPTTPTAALPTFSPAGGSVTAAQSESLADATAGATIYYTVDGSTPTASSAKYTAAIAVASTTTINALAVAASFNNSAIATATYTILPPPAAAPVFSPAAGAYTSAQSVTLSDSTAGATIYYTLDGSTLAYPYTILSDPTVLASPLIAGTAWQGYSGPPGAQQGNQNAFPSKGQWETEHSGGTFINNQFISDFNEITLVLRNAAKSYIKWSLALDQNRGPNLSQLGSPYGGCATCSPIVTVNNGTGAITKTIEYYTLGQYSKFILPGAVRVWSSDTPTIVSSAFINPDGTRVLVAFNNSLSSASFQVQWGTQNFSYTLPAFGAATFVWTRHPERNAHAERDPADPRRELRQPTATTPATRSPCSPTQVQPVCQGLRLPPL